MSTHSIFFHEERKYLSGYSSYLELQCMQTSLCAGRYAQTYCADLLSAHDSIQLSWYELTKV